MNELTAVPHLALAVPRDGDYEPFDGSLFANRNRERDLVHDKVKAAQTGPILRPLIEFYGVIGLGKTWLLSHLAHQYALQRPPRPDLKPTFSALIDFRQFSSPDHYYLLLYSAVQQIVAQFAEKKIPITSYASYPAEFEEDTPPPGMEKERIAEAFTSFLEQLCKSFVPILVFDTTEKAEEELFDWLEGEIVYPIVRTDRAIFVFSGRRWLRWKKFEVRRRVEPVEVRPFDKRATAEQLGRLRAESIAGPVYGLSFGHPLTTKAVYRHLRALRPESEPLAPELLVASETAVPDAVHDAVIADRFLKEIRPEDKRQALEPLLWVICVLRKFNPTPLRHFAIRFLGQEYSQKPGGFYLDAIRDLQESTLVQWSSAHSGYVLDPVVRKIMAQNLLMRDRERFHERHLEARKLYDEWIRKYPRNAASFLLERTFHQARFLQSEARPPSERQMAETLSTEFTTLVRDLIELPDAQWDLPDIAAALQEELSKDEELKDTIPKEAHDRLTHSAEEFVKRFRGLWS